MSEEPPNVPKVPKTILKQVFGEVSFEEAVVLVGILYEYRIVFSKAVSTICHDPTCTFSLKPLEPQAAARLMGELYSMDCDELFFTFVRDWGKLKGLPMVRSLLDLIQGHEYVSRLERFWWG
jgi:hypothetical protein